MATFFLFGKYDQAALKKVSAKRTSEGHDIIAQLGGSVKSEYALLGEHDIVLIVDLPGVEEAMKASLRLAKLTGIGFTTSPAVSIADFDRIATEK